MICITGGAGFIGLNFVQYLQQYTTEDFIVIDKFTYAANQKEFLATGAKYVQFDISNRFHVSAFFDHNPIHTIIHFAAETHVDNSIQSCLPFVQSNIIGTINLLDAAIKHNIRLLHISTDEVFGVATDRAFDESSVFDPRNPYSASKASAEHFVSAYANTYKLNYNIINSSNNYGPYQHREKLIPKTIHNLTNNIPVPLYGNGLQVRDWLYVSDTCAAIHTVYTKGKKNERYCIGGENTTTNITIVKKLCKILNKPESLIESVPDRPGHDIIYRMDITKIKNELKWEPKISIEEGLEITINHFKERLNV